MDNRQQHQFCNCCCCSGCCSSTCCCGNFANSFKWNAWTLIRRVGRADTAQQIHKYGQFSSFLLSLPFSLSPSLSHILCAPLSLWLASTCRVLHFVLKSWSLAGNFCLKVGNQQPTTFHSLFMRRYSLSLKSCAQNRTESMKSCIGIYAIHFVFVIAIACVFSPLLYSPFSFQHSSPSLHTQVDEWPILVVLKSRWWWRFSMGFLFEVWATHTKFFHYPEVLIMHFGKPESAASGTHSFSSFYKPS